MATAEQIPDQDPVGAEGNGAPVPPYFAFQTLLNQLDFMKERGVPNRIDRTFLVGMSGAGQAQYMTGLRSLGMIDAAGTVQPTLIALVNASVGERRRLMGEILEARYAKAVELGKTNATTGQLVELFRNEYGASGDTARKAIAFYLNAAKFAGNVPISPMFQTPKVTSSGVSKKRRPKPPADVGGGSGDVDDRPDDSPPLARDLHPALAGVLIELPRRGLGWTQAERDRFLKMFEMAVDFTIPIVDDDDLEDEIEEDASED